MAKQKSTGTVAVRINPRLWRWGSVAIGARVFTHEPTDVPASEFEGFGEFFDIVVDEDGGNYEEVPWVVDANASSDDERATVAATRTGSADDALDKSGGSVDGT